MLLKELSDEKKRQGYANRLLEVKNHHYSDKLNVSKFKIGRDDTCIQIINLSDLPIQGLHSF